MLLSDIHHKHTLKAIKKHQITDEDLLQVNNLQDLQILIRRYSRRLWYKENKQYFKDKYKNEYKEKVLPIIRQTMSNKYYLHLLPQNS